jgi:hypothetical protein
MKTLATKAVLAAVAMTLVLATGAPANAWWHHRRVVSYAALPSVPVTVGYAPVVVARPVVVAPTVVASPVVTATYAPAVTAYSVPTAAPVTTYYAPAPVTTYYAPTVTAAPVTTYYAPAVAPAVIVRRPLLWP